MTNRSQRNPTALNRRRGDWIGLLLARRGMPWVILVALLTGVLGWSALHVRIEEGNASMNARSEDRSAADESFRRAFGSDEVLLLGVTPPRLLDPAGIRLLDELTWAVSQLDGVARAESLTTARQLIHGELGAEDVPLIDRPYDRPGFAADVGRALDRNAWLTGLWVSADRGTAGIAIEIEDRPAAEGHRGGIVDALRSLIARYDRGSVELHLTGITVQKHDVSRLVERDRRLILPLSAAVLALALALIFRRRSGVILPLLVTLVALAWTLGLYAALGYSVNIITSLLPPVIMVLSISTSVHLYHGWIEVASRPGSSEERVRELLRVLLAPCFLTALTTALGLASLAASEIPAVQQFGLFGALGVAISFLLNITLLPLAFARLSAPPGRVRTPPVLVAGLNRLGSLSTSHPLAILVAAGLLSVAAAAGIALVRNNTDLVRFLKPRATLYQDTMYIDERLGGANGLDLVLRRSDGRPLTSVDDVRRMARFQDRVRNLDDVTAVFGVTDVIAQLHRAETGRADPTLPDDPDDLLLCFDLLEAAENPDLLRRLVSADFATARIGVRVRAVGTARARALIERILEASTRSLGTDIVLQPTGSFFNVTVDSNRLVASQVKSLTLALFVVALALGAIFRSRRLLLAALIPNLMPVIWTGGVMGWLGIDLSSGTVMVASVALGIAVDDTIHYLARFRREHRGDCAAAVRTSTSRVGAALVSSSVVLILGFWVGALGSFMPTVYFSLLTGFTILSALLCDLLVLPACLLLLRPRPDASKMVG